jgi:hypothetical protein
VVPRHPQARRAGRLRTTLTAFAQIPTTPTPPDIRRITAQPGTAHAVANRPDERLDALLTAIADNFSTSPRSPILHTPAERGLRFEDVAFPSEDGTPLEGWFVPAEGSDTVVIVNHPRFSVARGLRPT